MENRFNNRDFEQFVQQNADQYRMFPSEKVWDNIHNTLHVRKTWYGVGIILLFITVATVTMVMLSHRNNSLPIAQSLPPASLALNKNSNPERKELFIAPYSSTVKTTSDVVDAGKHHPSLFGSGLTGEMPAFTESDAAESGMNGNLATADLPAVVAVDPVEVRLANPVAATANIPARNPRIGKPEMHTALLAAGTDKPVTGSLSDKNDIAESDIHNNPAKETIRNTAELDKLSINHAGVTAVKINRNRKKIALQVYVTPLVSYRDLRENKAFIRAVQTGNIVPATYPAVPDVKNIVTHKPDLGIQLGLVGSYPLSKNISVFSGLQLTVSKYDIKAYNHPSEVTTIALSSAAGTRNTVSTYTNYRNIGGSNSDWLRNLYVSAAIPIGLEVKVAGNRKGYIGTSASVQPTFVIDNRSYLLSTDFKNYAQIPSLIRKVNMNAGFEVFAANTSGKIKWRIGPQVRYQTMSSFKKKYPVMEHLFDFGLKLGIMLR